MDKKLNIDNGVFLKESESFYVKYYDDTILNKVSFPMIFGLWRDVKASDIVIIQYVFNVSTVFGLLFASIFSKPVVLTPRGTLCKWCMKQGSRFKKSWLKLFIQPFLKRVIWHATSEEEKDDILTIFNNAKIEVIPNGIFIDEFQNVNIYEKREYVKKFTGLTIENINKVIISMGRLHKKKGFDILINAFKSVLEQFPGSLLLIAGEDEGERDHLQAVINTQNLQKSVFLIGSVVQDKAVFFANADLFVLASHNENFGNVYLEALASGTPIVASKGTPWKIAEDYQCGKWVENNEENITEAICETLKSDRDRLRRNAKNLVLNYSWDSISREFETIFQNIIQTK